MKTHGDVAWEKFPTYLPEVVPRFLREFEERGLRVTVFVVGKDAEDPRHRDVLRRLGEAGHEVGNHSYMHEPWLHLYDDTEIRDEVARAHDAIGEATGYAPAGFRGPGFSLSRGTVTALHRLGYSYDATAFPNILNPLGRAYFFRTSRLSAEERKRRRALFGTLGDAFRPNRPYTWSIDGAGRLLEIPVTTMPGVRIPIHFSYVLYLGSFSPRLARAYLALALRLCRAVGTVPSLLMHPLDFLGGDDEPDLSFFPGMKMRYGAKLELIRELLDIHARFYRAVPLADYAETLPPDLAQRPPRFTVEAG